MPHTFVNVNSYGEESTPLLRAERFSNAHRYTSDPPVSTSANRTSNWIRDHFSDLATPFYHATAPPPSTNASVRSSGHLHRFGYPHRTHPYRNATAPPLTIVESQRAEGHPRSGHAGNFNLMDQRSSRQPTFDSGPGQPLCPEVAEPPSRVLGTFGSSIEVAVVNLCLVGVVVVLALFLLGLCYVAVFAGIEIGDIVGAGGLAAYIAFIGLVLACWACACIVATTDD